MRFGRRRGATELEDEIPRLRRFARVLTRGDAAAADDLVQETLLRALGGLDSFREEAGLGTWMTTIMLNIHRSEHRRRVLRDAHLAEEAAAPEPSEPARQVQRIEVAETLEALDSLPDEQRIAIALVSIGDMSYADAARSLGVKLGTLMSRISRGRAAMRARLETPPEDREPAHGKDRTAWTGQIRRA